MATESSPGPEGTEWIAGLKVTELKDQLKKRGLAVGGNKAVLAARLTEAVEAEQVEGRAKAANAEEDNDAPQAPESADEQPASTVGQHDEKAAEEVLREQSGAVAEPAAGDSVAGIAEDAEQQPAVAESAEEKQEVAEEPEAELIAEPPVEAAAAPQTTDKVEGFQPDARELTADDTADAAEPVLDTAEPVPSPHAGAPEELLDFDYPEHQEQQQQPEEEEAEEVQNEVPAEPAAPLSTGKRTAEQLQQLSEPEPAEQPSKRSRHTPVQAPEAHKSATKTAAETPSGGAADVSGSAAALSSEKKRKHAPIPAPPARSQSRDLQKQPSNASASAAVDVGAPTEEQETQVAAAVEAAGDLPADATAAVVVTGLRRPFTPSSWLAELSKTGVVLSQRMTTRRDTAWVIFRDSSHAHATRLALNGKEWPQGNKSILRINFIAEEVAQAAIDATGDPAAAASAATSSLRRGDSGAAAAAAAGQTGTQQQEKPAAAAGASAADAAPKASASGGSVLDRLGPQNVKGRGMPAAAPIGEEAAVSAAVEAAQPAAAPASQPAPKPKQPEVLTLDDLFLKTTTKPCLYYLPLTDEQVAAKKQRASGGKIAGDAVVADGTDPIGPAVQEGLAGR